MPVVFVYDSPYLYSPIDRKAKRDTDPQTLRRIQNIETNGRVSLVVDRWSEDWSQLEWVRIEGIAELLQDGQERDQAAEALLAKYPQYQDLGLEGCPVIKVTVERITQWKAAQ